MNENGELRMWSRSSLSSSLRMIMLLDDCVWIIFNTALAVSLHEVGVWRC